MTIEQLRENLAYLIKKYVPDLRVMEELLLMVKKDAVPVKGILFKMTPFTKGIIEGEDYDLVGEISYYFC